MNAVILAVLVMVALSLARVSVVFALVVGALVGGLVGGLSLEQTLDAFNQGVGGGAQVALAYATLGAFAVAISRSGLPDMLANRLITLLGKETNAVHQARVKMLLLTAVLLVAISSQNAIPVHIAFIPVLIPPFLLGALFGQLMADSGAAQSIANGIVKKLGTHHVVLTVVMACAVLTYGGVSLFVVAFAIYPISRELFRSANVPKRLIPASIALGSFTFTMTALPGTPSIQNAIPIPYYETNSFAAPGLGIIAGLIMLGLGTLYLQSRVKKAASNGEGYGQHTEREAVANEEQAPTSLPLWLALIPIMMVIGLNALFTYGVFPALDLSFISDEFENVSPSGQSGLWAILIALLSASTWLIITRWKHWLDLKESVNKGCLGSLLPIFNTASEVGYGAVIASLAGFAIIRDTVLTASPGNPLISEALAMSVLAGITGSSSGGLSIALETLGSEYLAMAQQAGISPELMHRVATLAAGGMDTLPHSGAVITLLAICGLTHRQSYGNVAMVTIALPVIALISVITLGTLFGSF